MKSIAGRPRKVTDAQVEKIMAWHAARKTLAEVAAEIGVSRSAVWYVIARHGLYKQVSPEQRVETAKARRARLARLRRRGWL